MQDFAAGLARWRLDLGQVRERLYRAPTPRERERWHALWLLGQGWPANDVAAPHASVRVQPTLPQDQAGRPETARAPREPTRILHG